MRNVISDDEARDNLAANVSQILKFRGLTQTKLAKALGCPIMSLNNLCHGTRLVNVAFALRIGEVLGYTVEQLTGPSSIIEARERLKAEEKSLISA